MHDAPQDQSNVARTLGRRVFLERFRGRPRPSLATALSASGGIIVWIGVMLIALDVYTDGNDGWTGALFFVGLTLVALSILAFAPDSTHSGSFGEVVLSASSVSALVLSIPAVYGFLIFPGAESFGDVRWFFVLTIVTWAILFTVSNSRGRPILFGLAAALLYLWILGEVADTDAYVADPIPSPPIASPAAVLDGIRGETAIATTAEPAGFAEQDVTLDSLDPSDPLYPLAVDCSEGDFAACDELWESSEPGSDFEAFAESCGGDSTATYPCLLSGENLDDEFDDELEDDLDDPLDVTPLGNQDDQALEIGLVSLGFGAVYLAAIRLLDRRARRATATALVIPAVAALVTAASALGQETGSAIAGGLITLAVGLAIGVVGWFGTAAGIDRRFMTWGGGVTASIGALIVAADVAPEPSASDNVDLIGAGLVVARIRPRGRAARVGRAPPARAHAGQRHRAAPRGIRVAGTAGAAGRRNCRNRLGPDLTAHCAVGTVYAPFTTTKCEAVLARRSSLDVGARRERVRVRRPRPRACARAGRTPS